MACMIASTEDWVNGYDDRCNMAPPSIVRTPTTKAVKVEPDFVSTNDLLLQEIVLLRVHCPLNAHSWCSWGRGLTALQTAVGLALDRLSHDECNQYHAATRPAEGEVWPWERGEVPLRVS